MGYRTRPLLLVVVVMLFCIIPCCAQVPETGDQAVMVKFSPLTYPPLARQTRIKGDVILDVHLGKDGSVGEITVVQGNPILAQAAIDSVKRSSFECNQCKEAAITVRVVYSFRLEGEWDCGAPSSTAPLPRVAQSQNHVLVVDLWNVNCNPGLKADLPSRARCILFWKCIHPKLQGVE